LIALDTNILVYAKRAELIQHDRAEALLHGLAAGARPWALTWTCIYEFLRVVTHPRIFAPPTSLSEAIDGIENLLESSSLRILGEGPGHFGHMRDTLLNGKAAGNLVHDGHIAALLREHGITEIWTADRDFSRFPGLRVVDPFVTRTH
jgi:uncharacterized protein